MLSRVILDKLSRGLGLAAPPDLDARRRAMLAAIEAEARETAEYLGKDRFDRRVLEALAKVPRHEFVPPDAQAAAYDNAPLPIGHGQTISQPYIVAAMTDLLEIRPSDRLLEIGTGSGYQTAVLAELAARVYSVEFLPALAAAAAAKLKSLGYANVETREGDGWRGWPEHAPYDGIIVTAAASELPPALVAQLKPGRRLVVPVGPQGAPQELLVVEKNAAGLTRQRVTLPVAFVPLVSGRAPSAEPEKAGDPASR